MLSQRPQLIREQILNDTSKQKGPVIIDEIQKLPLLLDEVHNLIETAQIKFILTGSSPVKLKRGGVNLLGGRAITRMLFPLVFAEIPDFDLIRALNFGTIPSIYLSDEPEEDLIAYCGTYLQQEIKAEGLIRKIHNFSRFLQIAALTNTELINFEAVAGESGVPARTVREYYSILEDTLIGCLLEPYRKTTKRKPVSKAKFFFFDVGVCNVLANRRNIKPKTELFGKTLEHLIFTELRAYLSYSRDHRRLTFWRSRSGFEVDFLIGDDVAIEVKASSLVTRKHLKGINTLSEELSLKHRIVVSLDDQPRMLDGVRILPVLDFLKELWAGRFAI